MNPSPFFAPAVYEHAAALIGETPWRVSRDPVLLFSAHAEAFRRYAHAPVVAGIDIYNLEAEAYGARIEPPAGNGVPAITTHPCADCDALAKLPPFVPARDGRIPMVIEAGRRLAARFPEADVRIPVSGPLSLASNLIGFEPLLFELMDRPERVRQALEHVARGQAAFVQEVVSHGLGISLFESGATPPLISPDLFVQVELPVLKSLIQTASACAGRPVPCVMGGDTLPVLGAILETAPGLIICPCETDQASFMKAMGDHPEVLVRINMNPGIFSRGEWSAVQKELDRVLSLAQDRKRVCIGTGVLPFETDPALVLRAKAYVGNGNLG